MLPPSDQHWFLLLSQFSCQMIAVNHKGLALCFVKRNLLKSHNIAQRHSVLVGLIFHTVFPVELVSDFDKTRLE